LQIVVCCNQFPQVSETFVTSQVAGLERRGHKVAVMAETVHRTLLSGLPGGVPSGGVFSLIGDETEPFSERLPRLRLIGRSLLGLPGILARTNHPGLYARRGLRWTGLLAARAYARAGEIGSVDLVHAHMGPTALWARAVAARLGAPFAVTFHGSDVTRYPAEVGWSAYETLLEPPPATLIAHSSLVDRLIRAGLGVGTERVALGIDTALFTPPIEAGRAIHSRQPVRLAVIGRLVPKKGMRVAVEALALLHKGGGGERLDATLDIVGAGPEADALAVLAETLGVGSRCRLLGPRKPAAIAELLRDVDLLLVPSLTDLDGWQESFGVVCLEAQACGVLVVGTTCGGLPDAVAPPVGGRCVAEQSPLAMAAAVRELLGRPDQRAMRAAARARVLAAHTEEGYLAGYERVFELALGRRAAAGPPAVAVGARGGEKPDAGPSAEREGSLPAYVIGRGVVEIRRRPTTDRRRWNRMASSWTIANGEAAPAVVSTDRGREIIVLDLDGTPPGPLVTQWRNIARTIGAGHLAIIAVRGDGKQAEQVRAALAADFGQTVLLDQLFFPGHPGDVPAEPATLAGGGSREAPADLRYLLCVR
jgi:glycosyltransferase involved in cell wall biosynthesis